MAKKMKIPSIFKNREGKHPWQWHYSCKKQPKTHSFRADNTVLNSISFDPSDGTVGTLNSCFANSIECMDYEEDPRVETVDVIIRGLQSDRLIFKPGCTNSLILDAAKMKPLKGSVVLALESDDPYVDFKKSMEEMVETHDLKDWDCLEELLGWYLRMNEKTNHRFIVEAFVDLLAKLASSSSSSSSCFDSSNFCSFSRPLLLSAVVD